MPSWQKAFKEGREELEYQDGGDSGWRGGDWEEAQIGYALLLKLSGELLGLSSCFIIDTYYKHSFVYRK